MKLITGNSEQIPYHVIFLTMTSIFIFLQISLPLLILHGEADAITDPSVSKALYEKASSSDKTLLLYEDACHALLSGEFDEMIFQILDEIIHWLNEHGKSE